MDIEPEQIASVSVLKAFYRDGRYLTESNLRRKCLQYYDGILIPVAALSCRMPPQEYFV